MLTSIIIPSLGVGSALTDLITTIRQYTTLDKHNELLIAGPESIKWKVPLVARHIITDETVVGAINLAVSQSKGETIVILHDDAKLLHQEKDSWLTFLTSSLSPGVGCVGPLKLTHECGVEFISFFCAAFTRQVWNELGPLDSHYVPRGYEVDWCARASLRGKRLMWINDLKFDRDMWVGTFPIYHVGGTTILFPAIESDTLLMEKWSKRSEPDRPAEPEPRSIVSLPPSKVVESMDVTAHISTRDRQDTTLPGLLHAIGLQTLRPKKLVIFNDGDTAINVSCSPYTHLLGFLAKRGIEVVLLDGAKKGQVANHQHALEVATTPLLWRLDDDNVPEPNVLERLVAEMVDPSIGATASLISFPGLPDMPRSPASSGKIEDVMSKLNVQWFKPVRNVPEEVDHLHNTFLVRRSAAIVKGYPMNLSRVGHREETIFTHEIRRAGWKLTVCPEVVTWHFREGTGGIRSEQDAGLWQSDDQEFLRISKDEWGIQLNVYRLVVLDCGLGDHMAFLHAWPDILKKTRSMGQKTLLSLCYVEPFQDLNEPDVEIISIADAKMMDPQFEQLNVYYFMESKRWTGHIVDAFKALYA